MKYKTFDDVIRDRWELVSTTLPTIYSYFQKNNKIKCEDELIENWKMCKHCNVRSIKTYENFRC